MKITASIVGIRYGTSKAGKPYRVLYLEECDTYDTASFEGKHCYQAFAPADLPFIVGQVVAIILHKGDAIVVE